ncbi:MAG: hypothetical protein Kilf2KO_45370 [Rhodospirillales bacterium]
MSDGQTAVEAAREAYLAGDIELAKKACEKLLAADKGDAPARFLLSEILLNQGKLPPGFAGYEARWELPAFAEARARKTPPLWDGSPLGNKTLLLGAEQGLEECLQFCRYAPVILRRFPQAKVILEVPAQAQELISRSFSRVDRLRVVAAPSGENEPADLYLPLLSAPHRAQTTLNNIPAAKAYLYAKQPKRVIDEKELAIGLAWRSTAEEDGKRRSVPLAKLARCLQHPGTRLVALQEGDCEAECRHLNRSEGIALQNAKGVPTGTALGPWSDVVAGCDLVVTVDNAVAHLSAALGKETWVLLDQPPHWRWLLDREDSPWYPTARLFRQSHGGDWELMLPDLLDAMRTRMETSQAA